MIFAPAPPLLSILYMTIFLKFFSKLVYIYRIIGHVAAALGPLACAGRSTRPTHVAAALDPLACPSRSARPRKDKGPNLTVNMYTNFLKNKNGNVQN